MISEVFPTPDLLIVFTNRNCEVCWGGRRLLQQFKAGYVCEQTTDVFKRKLKSLIQSNAFFPTALPVFSLFPSYLLLMFLFLPSLGLCGCCLQVPCLWEAP